MTSLIHLVTKFSFILQLDVLLIIFIYSLGPLLLSLLLLLVFVENLQLPTNP